MTDSSNSNDVFPPWSLSRIQSTLHFILFTQQSFSEPCHMPSTLGSGSAVDRTDLLLPLLLGRVHVRELASSVISLLGSQPSLCTEHRRHSGLSQERLSFWNLCAMYFLRIHEHTSLLTTTISVPSMWLRKQWLNKSINEKSLWK